jgi:hypothetical protein
MKPMFPIVLLCVGIAIGAVAVYLVTPTPPAETPPPRVVHSGDVTDLIKRLAPLAYDPSSQWQGVAVTFTGTSAEIKIMTKDRNEYSGKGATLTDAVRMIDSTRIRDALSGWKSE